MHSAEALTALSHQLRHAEAPLRIVGSGTWLVGGGPFIDTTRIDTRSLNGVVAYEPGDLVITVGAGTTLNEIAAEAGKHGQMLACAPYGSNDSTIGACVATASAAPLALSDLTVRDIVLGLQVVTGTGDVIRGGGRVVKNVAGFDLVRLNVGAWGTLGVMTEVTVRLHAIPQVDHIMVGTLDQDVAHALPALAANRAPLPMVLRLRANHAPELWARISGNRARATALTATLNALGVANPLVVDNANALRETPMNKVVLRTRAPLSEAVQLVTGARTAFPNADLLYDPAKGSLRIIHDTTDRNAFAGIRDQHRATSYVRNALEQGLKRAMDPRDVLNRYAPHTEVSPTT